MTVPFALPELLERAHNAIEAAQTICSHTAQIHKKGHQIACDTRDIAERIRSVQQDLSVTVRGSYELSMLCRAVTSLCPIGDKAGEQDLEIIGGNPVLGLSN
jgi:hypothetical protein